MKTGKELILDLPNGVRRNFILQLAKEEGYEKGNEYLNEKHRGLKVIIKSAFFWHTSLKGYDYWRNINAKI